MNRSKLMRRLSVVAALAIVLAVAAGAPTLQAQPEAGTISTGAGVRVWTGHSCPANVPVSIASLSPGLGGYETKIGWTAGRFNNTPTNVGISLTNYLAVNGRVNSLGNIPPNPPAVAQPLKAVVGDSVKFADFSYGAGNPADNTQDGQLATVSLLPTAVCGTATLTVSDTQLVDINGNLIADTEVGGSVVVLSQYDTSGSGPFINSEDVTAVVEHLGPRVSGCNPGYQYDANADGAFFVNSQDVTAVVEHLGPTGCLP